MRRIAAPLIGVAVVGLLRLTTGEASTNPIHFRARTRPLSTATRPKIAVPGPCVLPTPAFADQIHRPEDYGGIPFPFRATDYSISTIWLGSRANRGISLYSGSVAAHPATGMLIVWATDPCGEPDPGVGFFELKSSGELTVTAVRGWIVTLEDASRRVHHFNLRTDRYA